MRNEKDLKMNYDKATQLTGKEETSYNREELCNRQGPVQKAEAGSLGRNSLKTCSLQQQSMRPSPKAPRYGVRRLYRSHAQEASHGQEGIRRLQNENE